MKLLVVKLVYRRYQSGCCGGTCASDFFPCYMCPTTSAEDSVNYGGVQCFDFDATEACAAQHCTAGGSGDWIVASDTACSHTIGDTYSSLAEAKTACADLSETTSVSITSDGTEERPHISWSSDCDWEPPTQAECAAALCTAAGYVGDAAYVSSSNNPCESSFSGASFYYYSIDGQSITNGSPANDAQITVTCGGTTGGSGGGDATGTQVTGDGTAERPYCSWGSTCNWDTESQAECATGLCNAAGYPGVGVFVSASNDPCEGSFTSDDVCSWRLDSDTVTCSATSSEAQVSRAGLCCGVHLIPWYS